MKITSGLPYDSEKMNTIKENGVIVDMGNINYPSISKENNIRVSYIYLRNTDFEDVKLDFQNTSYEFKRDFVKFYLKGDIEYNIFEMNETWIKIMGMYCNQYLKTNSIFSDEEMTRFLDEEEEIVKEIMTFVFSLPLYAISRLDIDDSDAIVDDIPHIKGKVINDNICNIIKDSYFNILFSSHADITPTFFDDIFTETNNLLFETLTIYTPFTALLYGMNQPSEWNIFINGVIETMTGVEI